MAIIGGALIGGAALSAGGGIFSSIFGGNAQIKAMRGAAEIAERTALTLDSRARADVAPFRDIGLKAGDTLLSLLQGNQTIASTVEESPLYAFQRDLGYRDLSRQLAARGLQHSGAGMETLQRFTTQLAAEEGNRFYERLYNLTALGANAASRMATNTTQTGNTLAGIQGQLGQATAGAIGAQYQGIGNVLVGAGNTLAQYPMYNASMNMLNRMGGSQSLAALPVIPPTPQLGQPYSMQAARLGITGVQ